MWMCPCACIGIVYGICLLLHLYVYVLNWIYMSIHTWMHACKYASTQLIFVTEYTIFGTEYRLKVIVIDPRVNQNESKIGQTYVDDCGVKTIIKVAGSVVHENIQWHVQHCIGVSIITVECLSAPNISGAGVTPVLVVTTECDHLMYLTRL